MKRKKKKQFMEGFSQIKKTFYHITDILGKKKLEENSHYTHS
jgi:hypothetical protein